MAQEALLNPLYIEQYGVTYVNPYDYAGLSTIYHSQDTRDKLTIDYDRLLLIGEMGATWQLKPADRDHFKPFYFRDSPMYTYDDILKAMYRDQDKFGKSIAEDIRWTRAIIAAACVPGYGPMRKPRHRFFGTGGGGGSDYAAMATGLWWGNMCGNGFKDL
ncbi:MULTISPECIES: hypothetical protein [Lactobacillaceae]|uniref:hypothetical protein n=1 Tax=Lactobacillaceae TaxID=33958 RepID=UPI001456BCF1|nr:hypothetical protein [Lactobacillus sp. HBUAS51381]NLR08369.1 hypothetical protein [Lactobacillus sp. HBUAS51381]